jgi:hypothetical protein
MHGRATLPLEPKGVKPLWQVNTVTRSAAADTPRNAIGTVELIKLPFVSRVVRVEFTWIDSGCRSG